MTLDGVLNKARALEAAATQANKMEIETFQTALVMRRNKPTRDQPNWRGQNDQHNEVNQPKQPMVRKKLLLVAASSTNDYQYVLPLSSVQQLPNYPSF